MYPTVVGTHKPILTYVRQTPRMRLMTITASTQQQVQKVKYERKNTSVAFLAVTLAVVISASFPALADSLKDSIKPKICAGNPTAKICLKGSAKQ